ncbi:TPA: glutamine--fructose-6-phosphate aminotransferase, partial [Candidatus Peregrinibacteria bacterium]|nr:glutamine--fructose-6-phosphate aminotransferase [Candidatus Peregrinibacteria bacterium]
MCGVFAISGLDITDAGEKVIEGLKKLEYRGYDSWGVATSHEMQKEVGKISCSTATFSQDSKAIGHSRWATHGGVTQENSHPHQYKKVTLVHNGIFENYLSEKNRLLEKGETFLSETDSEVIAHLIQEQLDLSHDPKSAIQNVAKAITGRFSIVVMIENFDEIFVARRGSPLIIGRGKGEYAQTTFIASDIPAFLEYTNIVNYIDDDEMAIIKNDDVAFYNLCSGEHIEKRNIAVSWKEEIAEKGDYNHFMIKEIFDQKQSLTSAINHSDKEIQEFISALQSGNGVYMVACGTTHKASIAAEYYFSQIA